MPHKTLTKADLTQFTGTEVWYKHPLVKNICYTEGVQYVAQQGEAYWLIDEIAFAQAEPSVKAQTFQHWKLRVEGNQTAMLTCEDGNYNVILTRSLPYTDFPLDEISFFFTNSVILLPSEY